MLHPYNTVVRGNKTTQLFSDADAAAAGLTTADRADIVTVTTKAKTPANKSRKPANKRAEAALGPEGAE